METLSKCNWMFHMEKMQKEKEFSLWKIMSSDCNLQRDDKKSIVIYV